MKEAYVAEVDLASLADCDHDLLAGVDAATVRSLRLGFSPCHVLEHNGGAIDERYQRETGEGSTGRRVRITPAFVDQTLDAVVALAERMEETDRCLGWTLTWTPYSSSLMRLMLLLDVLRERG